MAAIVIIGTSRTSVTTTVGAGPAYAPFANTQLLHTTTEAQNQIPVYTNGILRNLRVGIGAIGASTTHVIRLRKNGANGNLSVTCNATGVFTDTTNTDIVISGDLLDYSTTRTVGAGTITINMISSEFYNEDGAVIAGVTGTTAAPFNAGVNSLAGSVGEVAVGTNVNHRCFTFSNTILKNLEAYVITNTLNAGSTFIVPNTGTAVITNAALLPNLRLTIPAATTGLFTDTTDIFTMVDGTRWLFQVWNSGSSTGNITFSTITTHVTAEDSKVVYYTGRGIIAISTNNTIIPIMGSLLNGATPSGSYQVRVPQDCVMYPDDFRLGVAGNTTNSASILTFQVNGVDSAISATIPAGVTGTGTITGSGQPVFLQAGDLVNYNFTTVSTSGNMSLRMIASSLTVDKFEPSSDFFM